MTAVLESLNKLSDALLSRCWTMLWQWTVIAIVVGLLILAVRQAQPAVRFWLWQLVLLKLLLMPFWMVAVERRSETNPAIGASTSLSGSRPDSASSRKIAAAPSLGIESVDSPVNKTSSKPADSPAAPDVSVGEAEINGSLCWQTGILFAWSIIVLAQFSRIVFQRRRLRRFLDSTTCASDDLIDLVVRLSKTIGLRRPPRVALARVNVTPFVCGVSEPVLVLPGGLRDSLEPMNFRQVILHELAHLKRRDLLWGWFPAVVRIVFVFHPLVLWICSRIHLERELACDQLAMHYTDRSASSYAQTLVDTVSRNAVVPVTALDGEGELITDSSSTFSGAVP